MRTCVSCAIFETRSGKVIFRVKDNRGPLITIHSTCAGNQRTESEFYVKKEVLEELSKFFAEAANHEYKSNAHYNQGELATSMVQGDIDDYGDVTAFGHYGGGDGTASNMRTLPDSGYHLTTTLIIDDDTYDGLSIVPGTAKGIVCRLGKEVQKFTVSEDGRMNFEKIDDPIIYIVEGVVDQKNCTAKVTWNDLPGANELRFDFDFTTREK